jgi:hypothetical protein
MPYVPLLTSNGYGNFVIQHMVTHGDDKLRHQIIIALQGVLVSNLLLFFFIYFINFIFFNFFSSPGSFFYLSQHKYASNVVEKLIEYSDVDLANVIIREILHTNRHGMERTSNEVEGILEGIYIYICVYIYIMIMIEV